MSELGLPTMYGALPVAAWIAARIAPAAGSVPPSTGSMRSGLVPMNLAPPSMSWAALRMVAKLKLAVLPTTTYSGWLSVIEYPTL